jgi:hypothetical protein
MYHAMLRDLGLLLPIVPGGGGGRAGALAGSLRGVLLR